MILNEYGFEELQRRVVEYHNLDSTLADNLFFAQVYGTVFNGDGITEAIESLELNSTTRVPLVKALYQFDLGLTSNMDLPLPDPYDDRDDGVVAADRDVISLAQQAWEILKNEDNYVESIFCLTVLATIYLSTYQRFEVDVIDFSPLMEAYKPLRTAIMAKEFEYEYKEANS